MAHASYSYVLKWINVSNLYEQFSQLHTSSSEYIDVTLAIFVHFLFKVKRLISSCLIPFIKNFSVEFFFISS